MGYGLNLTDDQRRRIEDAKSPEERATVFMEAAGGRRELSDEEIDALSGGDVRYIPPTHAAIDAERDTIQYLWDTYGRDYAARYAHKRNLIARWGSFGNHSVGELRGWLHRKLDGTGGLSDAFGGL